MQCNGIRGFANYPGFSLRLYPGYKKLLTTEALGKQYPAMRPVTFESRRLNPVFPCPASGTKEKTYRDPMPGGFSCASRSGVSALSSQSMLWSSIRCSTTTSSRWQPTVP